MPPGTNGASICPLVMLVVVLGCTNLASAGSFYPKEVRVSNTAFMWVLLILSVFLH